MYVWPLGFLLYFFSICVFLIDFPPFDVFVGFDFDFDFFFGQLLIGLFERIGKDLSLIAGTV